MKLSVHNARCRIPPGREFKLCFAIALFSTVLLSKGALGEIIQISPGHFQCSMHRAQFNREDIAGFAKTNRLAGRIRLVAKQTDPTFPSSAGLIFELEGKVSAGALVTVAPDDAKHVYLQLVLFGPNQREQLVMARWPREAWVPVKAELDDKGLLTVSSGRFSKHIKVGRRAVIGRVVHCQSGSFEVDVNQAE